MRPGLKLFIVEIFPSDYIVIYKFKLGYVKMHVGFT